MLTWPAPWFIVTLLACALASDAPVLTPVRHPTCIRFYGLEGDVKPDVLRKAVSALGKEGAAADIVAGPLQVSSRKRWNFVALELPSNAPAKEIQAALKKVSSKAEELAWTAFQGEDRSLPAILGFSALECVVGMDNDMRWFDLAGGRARFFYAPGKLDAEVLRKKFGTLYQPFDAGELGELVHGPLEWKLKGPIEPAAVKAAEKALAKVPGVRKPKIDAAKLVLTAEIEHDGLRSSCGSEKAAGGAESKWLPPGAFLVDDVLDALAAAKIATE